MSVLVGDAPGVNRPDYRRPGALTQLTFDQQAMVAAVGDDPEALCLAAQHLLVLPGIPTGAADEAEERDVIVDDQDGRNLPTFRRPLLCLPPGAKHPGSSSLRLRHLFRGGPGRRSLDHRVLA